MHSLSIWTTQVGLLTLGLKALNADVQLELVTLWPELGQGAAQHVYGDTPRPFARFKELPPKQQQVQLFHLP